MTLKATGPGKSRVDGNHVLLFNFDIDGTVVKSEHRTALIKDVVPELKAGRDFEVIGMADRLGDATYNRALSQRRIDAVVTVLRSLVSPELSPSLTAFSGETPAQQAGEADGSTDEMFRAVMINLLDNPNPPRPSTVKKQDLLIEIIGFDGKDFPQGRNNPGEEDRLRNKYNIPKYLETHEPLVVMHYCGGIDGLSPVPAIIKRLDAITPATVGREKSGRVFVHGGSGGGKNVIEVIRHLRKRDFKIRYGAIWDGSFGRTDLVDQGQLNDPKPANLTLLFKGVGVMMNEGAAFDGWFQSWSQTLDWNQDLHGNVVGFFPSDVTDDPKIVVIRKAYERSLSPFGSTRQKAIDDAHTAAYEIGREKSTSRIDHELKKGVEPAENRDLFLLRRR